MKNKIKTEGGSITLFVLISMLFMTMFLMTIYTLSTNNEISQREATRKIKEIYEVGLNNIDEVYSKVKENKPIIIFTYTPSYSNQKIEFEAREGMTWEEWYNSGKFETGNFIMVRRCYGVD